MNKYCRAFLIWSVILSLGMTGCAFTPKLIEKINNDASYTEEITSVLMPKNGTKLVFIGGDYHYIFDVSVELSHSLNALFRKLHFLTFKEFRVDKNDHITGNITITPHESIPALELSLQGERYKSGGIAIDRVGDKLNSTYKVTILEERSFLEKAALTATTPVAVLADGVLVIGEIALIILCL
ncbi:MAG: hypothetical protein KAI29_21680 [Cyclobacteriaceae bacterium]|nr:hypothetical protein [Cyclobacteriaceae bacterium]